MSHPEVLPLVASLFASLVSHPATGQEPSIPYELVDFDGDGQVTEGDAQAAAWYEEATAGLYELLETAGLDPATAFYDLGGFFTEMVDSSPPSPGEEDGSPESPTLALTEEEMDDAVEEYWLDPALHWLTATFSGAMLTKVAESTSLTATSCSTTCSTTGPAPRISIRRMPTTMP